MAICWEPRIKLWRLTQACTGPLVDLGLPFLVGRLDDNTVSHHGVWEEFCLHTAPMESITYKSETFGIYHRLRVPQLFLYISSLFMHFTL
jgi:hypothetical protein